MYFNKLGLVVGYDNECNAKYVPMKYCRLAFEGMQAGKPYWKASSVYALTRQQAGYILANFKE